MSNSNNPASQRGVIVGEVSHGEKSDYDWRGIVIEVNGYKFVVADPYGLEADEIEVVGDLGLGETGSRKEWLVVPAMYVDEIGEPILEMGPEDEWFVDGHVAAKKLREDMLYASPWVADQYSIFNHVITDAAEAVAVEKLTAAEVGNTIVKASAPYWRFNDGVKMLAGLYRLGRLRFVPRHWGFSEGAAEFWEQTLRAFSKKSRYHPFVPPEVLGLTVKKMTRPMEAVELASGRLIQSDVPLLVETFGLDKKGEAAMYMGEQFGDRVDAVREARNMALWNVLLSLCERVDVDAREYMSLK